MMKIKEKPKLTGNLKIHTVSFHRNFPSLLCCFAIWLIIIVPTLLICCFVGHTSKESSSNFNVIYSLMRPYERK